MKNTLLLLLPLLVTCGTTSEPLKATPPDSAGWTALPVEDVRVEREAERHVVSVDTHTRSAGWELALLPYTYNRSPRIYKLRLVGRPPAQLQAEQPQNVIAVKTLALQFSTKFIAIEGANGTYKASVPWMGAQ